MAVGVIGTYALFTMADGSLDRAPARVRDGDQHAAGAMTAGKDENRAPNGTREAADLATLMQQGERQIAQSRLQHPTGDNALETYRRIAALHGDFPEVEAIGKRLSGALYLEAQTAMQEERWDDALHSFQILETLPPVPPSMVVKRALAQEGVPDRDGMARSGRRGGGSADAVASDATAGDVAAAKDKDPLRQAFRQFVAQQVETPPGEREFDELFDEFRDWRAKQLADEGQLSVLFAEFQALHAQGRSGDGQARPVGREAPNQIWQALDGTNIREAPSATSRIIGIVNKGDTFRVTGSSADGKWLKTQMSDGSTGYYWTSRARRTR